LADSQSVIPAVMQSLRTLITGPECYSTTGAVLGPQNISSEQLTTKYGRQ